MEKFPNLKIDCPHFCLTSRNLDRLASYFDKYPNFYTDFSFGYYTFTGDGFWRISKQTEKFREFVIKYADRFLFGADLVVTKVKVNSKKWLKEMPEYLQCYRDILEEKNFTCSPLNNYLQRKLQDKYPPEGTLNGLELPVEVLQKIYEENPERFLND